MDLIGMSLPWMDDVSNDCSHPSLNDLTNTIKLEQFGPTPPHSPEYELNQAEPLVEYPIAINSFMEELYEPQCRCQQPIVRDCMWSVNAPKTLSKPDSSLQQDSGRFCRESNIPVLDSCSDCAGLESTPLCVDSRTIFNLPYKFKSPVKKQLHQSIVSESIIEETVCFMKSEAINEYSICISDDDYEVDVECLSDSCPDYSLPGDSLPDDSLSRVQLANSAASAQIAEMHNYSQLSPPPSVSSARSCSSRTVSTTSSHFNAATYRTSSCRVTSSAPQSPSVPCSSYSQNRHGRPAFSNPTSPSVYSSGRNNKNNRSSRNAKKRKLERQQQRRDGMLRVSPLGSSDSDCEVNRRAQHNVLERKRRNNLKEFFNKLRDEVPHLSSDVRTSKVVILQGARSYIAKIVESEKQVAAERQRMIRYQEGLKQRLQVLRSMKARQHRL